MRSLQPIAIGSAVTRLLGPALGPKLGRDREQSVSGWGTSDPAEISRVVRRPKVGHVCYSEVAFTEDTRPLRGLYSATSDEKGVETKNANRPNLRTDVVSSSSFSPQNSPVQGNGRSSSYRLTSCSIAISAHPSTICSFFGHSSQNLSLFFTHHVQPCRECYPP